MLKRFLVLACALVLFVTGFFVHQWWVDARMEHQFRLERERFGLQGQDFVTASVPPAEPLTPTPPPLPVVATPSAEVAPAPATDGSAPSSGGATAPADVPLNSNTLIGPVPPPSTPGDSATPATPATNTPPDSTFIYPGLRRLPLLLLGSYNLPHPLAQATGTAPAAPSSPAAPNTPAPVALSGTNGPPAPQTVNPSKMPPAESTRTNAVSEKPEPVTEGKGEKGAISAIVLLYHQFTPPGVRAAPKFQWTMPQDVFAFEMKYLHDNHYNVVPLADVIAFAKGTKQLPPNAVALTFDDGYKSPLVFAKPILDSYKFPWTFFIYPAFIGEHPTTNYRGAASWPELVELQKEGVDIECHSMTHPILNKKFQDWPPGSRHAHLLTPEEYDAFLTNEIVTSKEILEKQLGKTITCFAYPFGEYNLAVQSKAIAAGYEAIFTVAGNPIHVGTPLKSMGRYTMTTPVEKMFTAYLNQRSLILADIVPAPGATTTDPRPVISAELRYAGSIKPDSIIAEVSGMGEVKTDYDPKSSALRLFLPRDLVSPKVLVDVRAKDADSGKTVVASWRFAYQATATGATHPPIGTEAGTNTTPSPAEPVHAVKTMPAAGTTTGISTSTSKTTMPAPAEPAVSTPAPVVPAPATSSNATASPAAAAPLTNAAP